MSKTKFYTKKVSCEEGLFFNEDHYEEIINEDYDGYYINENNERKILFKFRKNVIDNDLSQIAYDTFLSHSKRSINNRGYAGGSFDNGKIRNKVNKTSRAVYASSNISGYFDRPYQQIQKHFKTKIVCRTTRFTKNNKELFEKTIPFFQAINDNYKLLAPYHYDRQLEFFKNIKPSLKIKNTVFTTITSNYNWRTASHKDAGDFENGLGNLTITGNEDWSGCYIGFPEYKVAINIRKGDFLLMDVHQLHCNTEFNNIDTKGIRLSFVCYLRKYMVDCNKKKIVNGETFFYKE